MSALEMSLVTRDLIESPLSRGSDYLIGPAPLMTALDMKGFSVTSMTLTPLFEEAICAPVEVTGWVPAVKIAPLQPVNATKRQQRIRRNPQIIRPSLRLLTASVKP